MFGAGKKLITESDIIIPIPLHRGRYFIRRYNQSAELGRAIAKKTGLPFLPELLVRKKATEQQVGLTRIQRTENVRGAFKVPEQSHISISGRRVLLIDDVLTTGATANAASKALLKASAEQVNVLTFSQVVPGFVASTHSNS